MGRKIGIVGVGGIGLAMARNLIAAGHTVTGYRRGAMDDFAAAGGIPAPSPAAVAETAGIVFASLPGAAAMTEVLDRPDGLLAGLQPGQIVVDTTTMTPAEKRGHAGRIGNAGGIMLDCPVSGTPGMMTAGRAAFFVGGDRATTESIRDVLEDVAAKVTWVGDVGAGAATKSVATALVAIHNLAAAEGLAIALREGGDIAAVHEAISDSPAGSAMFELRGALMAQRDYAAGSGSLEGYLRGLDAVYENVSEAGPVPLLEVTRRWYRDAVAAGHTGRDQAAIFEYLLEAG